MERVEGHFFGSDKERIIVRRQSFNMIHRMSRFSLFITANIFPGNMYTVHIMLGSVLPTVNASGDVDKKILSDATVSFPAIYAQAFIENIDEFFATVFGWDAAANLPKEEGGLFGFVQNYCATFEANGREFLHAHCMARILGWFRTGEEKDDLFQIKDFQEMFRLYTESILVNYKGLDIMYEKYLRCTHCHVPYKFFESIDLNSTYREKPQPWEKEPEVAKCLSCHAKYTSTSLMDIIIANLIDENRHITFPSAASVLAEPCYATTNWTYNGGPLDEPALILSAYKYL